MYGERLPFSTNEENSYYDDKNAVYYEFKNGGEMQKLNFIDLSKQQKVISADLTSEDNKSTGGRAIYFWTRS